MCQNCQKALSQRGTFSRNVSFWLKTTVFHEIPGFDGNSTFHGDWFGFWKLIFWELTEKWRFWHLRKVTFFDILEKWRFFGCQKVVDFGVKKWSILDRFLDPFDRKTVGNRPQPGPIPRHPDPYHGWPTMSAPPPHTPPPGYPTPSSVPVAVVPVSLSVSQRPRDRSPGFFRIQPSTHNTGLSKTTTFKRSKWTLSKLPFLVKKPT